ncbi:DEAD/DEAH box helicase [Cupriavidus sp. TMH.W2]|uniref:DEAD/DEAH box helicase n=1 Tax=Cupriavidus sp. TMH.W2 TaxID=3434465 RepID=UPI003D76DF38
MALVLRTLGQTAASGPLVESVVFDGFDYAIRFARHTQNGPILTAEPFKGRYIGQNQQPAALRQHWRFGRHVIDNGGSELIAQLCRAGARDIGAETDLFRSKLRTAAEAVQPTAFTAGLKYTIYALDNGAAALTGSYHPATIALAKGMRAVYLAPMKAWKFAATSPEMLRENLLRELGLTDGQVTVVEGVYSIVDDAFSQQGGASEATVQTFNNAVPEFGAGSEESVNELYLAQTSAHAAADITEDELAYWLAQYPDLYPFQHAGVRHLLVQNSSLLADDMGLGKTRQAIVAMAIRLRRLQQQGTRGRVLIVCPVTLIYNWATEIRNVIPDAQIATESYDDAAQWVIVSYGVLGELERHAAKFQIMAVDEAHQIKTPTTIRTRHAFDVAVHIETRILLTATPILNRESELHTLLRLSGHPLGNLALKEFAQRFSGDPAFRAELRQAISKWMLRRKKTQVLKTLKGKQVQPLQLQLSEDLRKRYDAVANDGTLLALPKISRLRMLLEEIKVDSIVQMVTELAPEDKFLIFCEFKETVQLYRARLAERGIKCVTMVGTDSARKRQRSVEQFQNDEETDGFIGTTAAAGVGTTLTKANHVFFGGLPWTSALKVQAEDRAYRIGQQRMVVVKLPLAHGTIDFDVMQLLMNKDAIASEVLDDPEDEERLAREKFAAQFAKMAA